MHEYTKNSTIEYEYKTVTYPCVYIRTKVSHTYWCTWIHVVSPSAVHKSTCLNDQVYCLFQRSDLSEITDSDSILLQDNLNKKFGDWQTKRWELVFVLFNIFFLNLYFKLKQPISTSSETSSHYLPPQTAYTIDSLELKEMNRNVSHCVC